MIKLKSLLSEIENSTHDFKLWFKNSKVVDKTGNPLIVYHGSDKKIDKFDKEKIGTKTNTLVNGYFFTDDKNKASEFGKNITSVFLSLQNPVIINAEGRNVRAVLGTHEEGVAKDRGHDGFIIKNVIDTLGFVMTVGNYTSTKLTNLYIVFESSQIYII